MVLLFPLVVIIVFSAIIEVIIMFNNKDLFFKEIRKIDLLVYTITGSLIVFVFIKEFYGENSSGGNISIFHDYSIGVNALIHISITSLLLLLYIYL